MEEGDVGKTRRKKAREVGENARKAMEEGGRSDLSMTLFIQNIMQMQQAKYQMEDSFIELPEFSLQKFELTELIPILYGRSDFWFGMKLECIRSSQGGHLKEALELITGAILHRDQRGQMKVAQNQIEERIRI